GSYGVESGLICSFPVMHDGVRWQIVKGLEIDEFSRNKIDASVAELKAERAMVADLLGRGTK
ncbi:MAG: malate dehydrogenase, partial [Verrucomicrobiia bacterium]